MGNGCNKMSKPHKGTDNLETVEFYDENDAIFWNSATTSSCTGSLSEDSDTKNVTPGYRNVLHRLIRRRTLNESISFNRKLYQDRKEGMALLSQICVNTSVSGNDDDGGIESTIEAIDWDTLIKRAENLHALEQNNLRKRRNRMASSVVPTKHSSKDEMKKRQRTSNKSAGETTTPLLSSFSINLMLMRQAGKHDAFESLDDLKTKEFRNEPSTRWIAPVKYEPYASCGSEDSHDSKCSKVLDC